MNDTSLRAALFNRRMLICCVTGFSSGLPLYVLFQLIPAWMHDHGVSLTEIGLFALIGFPYNWKFLWSPLMDHITPYPGLRRGWMLLTQFPLLLCIAAFGFFPPENQLAAVAILAVATAFFSASQDIVVDAYRRELLPDEELGLGNSLHVNAYRVSSLIPGSLSLILTQWLDWQSVFMITALFMLPGITLACTISEPNHMPHAKGIRNAVVLPFREYFERLGVHQALWILLFMLLYKLGDSMATALTIPFYKDIGFSNAEIGMVAKHAALWPAIIGGIMGGIIMIRLGINRSLWAFGFVQIFSILGYVVLAESQPSLWLLAAVVGFEYLGVGLGTTAFVAFIARTTSRQHTATQFALFTALAAIPRTFANASTGWIVEQVGWTGLFIGCFLIAIPGMLLLFKVAPWNGDSAAAKEPS